MGTVYLKDLLVLHETPTPATDGSQTVFQVANVYVPGTLEVWLDGLPQIKTTDYTEEAVAAPTGFTMGTAPDSDEALRVKYLRPTA